MKDFRHNFGPDDTTAIAVVPGASFVVEELSNFSISAHIEKKQIRRVGHRFPVGWAVGSGTIAGTFVFAQMTEGPLYKLRRYDGTIRQLNDQGISGEQSISSSASNILPEQLPPFHLVFVHVNESGQMGIERLYDVMIESGGKTTGQQNKFTESHKQYKALYYENLHLQKNLSTRELASLADQEVGFFNDFREVGSLVDGVSQAVGADNLAEYVSESTLGNYEAYLEGESSPITQADQGNVVYDGAKDETADPVKGGSKEEIDAKNRSWGYFISDDVIKGEPGSYGTENVAAYLEVDGSELYINESSGQNLNTSVATLGEGGSPIVTVPAEQYYSQLLKGSDLSFNDISFVPETIELEVGEQAAHRTRRYEDPQTSSILVPPTGTFLLEYFDILPAQEAEVATDADGNYIMQIKEGPFFPTTFGGAVPFTLQWDPAQAVFGGAITFQYGADTSTLTGDAAPLNKAETYEFPDSAKISDYSWKHTVSDSELPTNPTFEVVDHIEESRLEVVEYDATGGESWSTYYEPGSDTITLSAAEFEVTVTKDNDFLIDGVEVSIGYYPDQLTFTHSSGDAPSEELISGSLKGRSIDLSAYNGSAEGDLAGISLSGQSLDSEFELVSGSGVKVTVSKSEPHVALTNDKREL